MFSRSVSVFTRGRGTIAETINTDREGRADGVGIFAAFAPLMALAAAPRNLFASRARAFLALLALPRSRSRRFCRSRMQSAAGRCDCENDEDGRHPWINDRTIVDGKKPDDVLARIARARPNRRYRAANSREISEINSPPDPTTTKGTLR